MCRVVGSKMVNDNEPAQRLLDVGEVPLASFYVNPDLEVAVQEAQNNNEIVLENDGSIRVNTETIWDGVVEEIPDSALGTVDAGTVNLGRGLENDGTGQIQFDEDTAYTFTSDQTFNAGLNVATGQSIDDGNGNPRVVFKTTGNANFNGTTIRPNSGDIHPNFQVISNDHIGPHVNSTEIYKIFDEEGVFDAVKYTTNSSAPGTLELTNAKLDFNDNRVDGVQRLVGETTSNFIRFDNGSTDTGMKYGSAGFGHIFTNSNGNSILDLQDNQRVDILNGDLRLGTGQSIEDGSGIKRVRLDSTGTDIFDGGGNRMIQARKNTELNFLARSSEPVQIFDRPANVIGVQYLASSTAPGTFKLTNAELLLNEDRTLISSFDGSGNHWIGIDGATGEPNNLALAVHDDGDGAPDRVQIKPDLRIETGQSIEDGSGTKRFGFSAGQTGIFYEDGTEALEVARGLNLSLRAYTGTPVTIFDEEGGFNSVAYTTSSSAPGTLELRDATLDPKDNEIRSSQDYTARIGDTIIYDKTDLDNINNGQNSDPSELRIPIDQLRVDSAQFFHIEVGAAFNGNFSGRLNEQNRFLLQIQLGIDANGNFSISFDVVNSTNVTIDSVEFDTNGNKNVIVKYDGGIEGTARTFARVHR